MEATTHQVRTCIYRRGKIEQTGFVCVCVSDCEREKEFKPAL